MASPEASPQSSQSGPVQRPGPGMRPRTYRTEALVLRTAPAREADRLVTVLTPSLGKLRVTVRGARRITSRLGGHLDLFNRVDLTLALGHRFDVVTGAEAKETFPGLKADLERVATGMYLMELADGLLPEAAPHPDTHALLLDALRSLDRAADTPGLADANARYVELRLLEDAGYLPELRDCLVCGRTLSPGSHRFAPGLGGTVCDSCAVSTGPVLPLSTDALKLLRHYAREPLDTALRVRLTADLGEEMEALLASALQYVLEREVSSMAFVDHLRRLRRRARGAAQPDGL